MKGIKAAMKPESGQRFGRWTVLDGYITTSQGERKYLCRCDCGTERYVLERSLQQGGSQRCGCLRMERARQATAHDLFGQTFGELKVGWTQQEAHQDGRILDMPVHLRLYLRSHGSRTDVRA